MVAEELHGNNWYAGCASKHFYFVLYSVVRPNISVFVSEIVTKRSLIILSQLSLMTETTR